MLYLSSLFLNIYYKVCNTNKVDVIMFGFKEIPLHVIVVVNLCCQPYPPSALDSSCKKTNKM